MTAIGPGCVKTRGRTIAIEQVSRSRSFEVPASQSNSISRSNFRISFSSHFKALSLMGLAAAFGLAAAPTVLTVSDAEAQTAAAPTAGMERRHERRAARHERRQERRMARTERRQERRTGTATDASHSAISASLIVAPYLRPRSRGAPTSSCTTVSAQGTQPQIQIIGPAGLIQINGCRRAKWVDSNIPKARSAPFRHLNWERDNDENNRRCICSRLGVISSRHSARGSSAAERYPHQSSRSLWSGYAPRERCLRQNCRPSRRRPVCGRSDLLALIL